MDMVKMDWYQPELLADGTYEAQNSAKTQKYTYKINWRVSNPYHLKVYYEGRLIHEHRYKTRTAMRQALETQLRVMSKMNGK